MAPHPLINHETDRIIVELYDAGVPVIEIAQRTRTSNGTVYNALRRQRRRPDRKWVCLRHRQWYGPDSMP